jgi:EAL domain-containing protein (putative c-di-GMP-specific phosphodiesterase class I)
MTRQATDRVELENELRMALEKNELELQYQPQVVLSDGHMTGVEALMRWRHAARGWVPPLQFVAIAEDSDLIHRLGEFALVEGCRQVKAWDAAGLRLSRLAVNVSAQQFRSPVFVDTVARALQAAGLESNRLELELTESVLVKNREAASLVLTRLKALGVRIAVDDFGTGYSSLSYLSQLPIDCLKIDRAFVHKVHQRGGDAAIAQAIVSLAHSLGLRVVAVGVETAEQLEFLRSHGCDEAQGNYFSPAVRASAIVRLAKAGALPIPAAVQDAVET